MGGLHRFIIADQATAARNLDGDVCAFQFVLQRLCKVHDLSFLGRPPLRPRALAAFSPASVRSRIRLRSNSASAPKTWNTSCPEGERVSICSFSEANPTPRVLSSCVR